LLVAKELVSDGKDKPVLDEQVLAKLLEAAYVLQEHNLGLKANLELQADELREQEAASQSQQEQEQSTQEEQSGGSDYTPTLAQIVETQRLIQVRHLDLEHAMALVAERVSQITKASGAAIGILDGKIVRYCAGTGKSALPQGTEVPMGKSLCFSCFRTGQPFRCPDVHPEFLLDAQECQRRGIQSLIAVPVYQEGGIAGALELYFENTQACSEQDVHTCQLMAGLVTEAFARDSQHPSRESQAAERASMLQTLERLKPNLAAIAGASEVQRAAPADTPVAIVATKFVCRKCGHALVGEEQFCGKCGSPRTDDDEPPSVQSKVASLWKMQQAAPTSSVNSAEPQATDNQAHPLPAQNDPDVGEEDISKLLEALQLEQPEFIASAIHPQESTAEEATRPPAAELAQEPHVPQEEDETTGETALTRPDDDATWTSAAHARDFLEQLAGARSQSAFGRFWNARRGDIYLAIAVILMAGVIRWGIWSNHSVSATGGTTVAGRHKAPAPDADLSVFDKLMITVGLAEPPEAPEYKGNPEVQVWVDLQTALYYCPASDLYGKTPKGKFTTQRDAQLDQFEPAYRKACD
jgi:putative methionine-R-sulfoxide reductase with GAF domain